jgi:hypothetical protein
VHGGELSMHRRVQAVARDRLDEQRRGAWMTAAVHVVNASFPYDSYEVHTWPTSAQLLPHASAAAGHAEALRVEDEATGRLLNRVGLYLSSRARVAEAKGVLELQGRALDIRERDSVQTAPTPPPA